MNTLLPPLTPSPSPPSPARSALPCALCCALLLLSLPSPSYADEGSFLFLEPHVGISTPLGTQTHAVGPAFGATLGMGGRIPKTPLRAFATAQFHYSAFEILRSADASTPTPMRRAFSEGSLGGRALVAITPHWRAFIDLGVALTWLERQVFYPGFGIVSRSDRAPRPSFLSGLGLQWRPIDLFSFGLRADFGVLLDTDGLDDTQDSLSEVSGRLNLCAVFAVHL